VNTIRSPWSGWGTSGLAIASRLADQGWRVTGFDPNPTARERARDRGIIAPERLAQAVSGSAVVLTCLPSSSIVTSVWTEGDQALVTTVDPGAVLCDLSTIDPQTMAHVAHSAARHGLVAVDAAISGGPIEAPEGKLTLVVGGSMDDFDHLRPVFDTIAAAVLHAGEMGSGKTLKLVNNMIANGLVLLAAEAFQVGVSAGIPPKDLFNLLSNMGGGRSSVFQKRFPWAVEDDFQARFSIRLGEKDYRLSLELAEQVGVPVPVASLAKNLYSVAMAEGFADDDIVGILQLYRRWATLHGS
jgi:3-hydroxyisobutyrate dehydrogenase-like beta-hydroxyacid dehydrogenase